ncbi:acyl-coenzyme A diphosphatase FITM2 [Centruroides vittatus]|uniref:acyl-coenzyme A diphosphatase FITM2 n=1 Tax=Centruroides vittatus TaxID=120091 RepID=UPI003510B1B7
MAGGKKQSNVSSKLKWQNYQGKKGQGAGRKPVSEQATVKQVTLLLFMHICRKIVLIKPDLKVSIYFGALMFGSLVCDFIPMPRSYMARKDNVFNKYFVKLGWGWTLCVVGTFVFLTSWTYCCGNAVRVRKHLSRVLIGTVAWYCWTTLFVFVETWTGSCTSDRYSTRLSCLRHGHRWTGFDISGHAFLLVYSNLFLMEEAKCIRGWERIGELIRNEEFDEDSPLRKLEERELSNLKNSYEKYTVFIKALFIFMTGLYILWDVMLIGTILYFHTMVQKVAGGIIAVLTWFFTYRVWYHAESSPGLPGQGPFKYSELQRIPRIFNPADIQ